MLLFQNKEQIRNALYLATLKKDALLLYIEDNNETKSIPSIIKFLKRIKVTIPTRNSRSSYLDFDINILYPNPKKFVMIRDGQEETIKKNAPIASNIYFNGGSKKLIKQAHDNCNSIIAELKELESILIDEILEQVDNKILDMNNLEEFPKFGNWHKNLNKTYFILSEMSLNCLSYFFFITGTEEVVMNVDLYKKLREVIYKDINKQFELVSFVSAFNSKNKQSMKNCLKKHSITEKEGQLFIHYMYKFSLVKQKTTSPLNP